MARNWRLAGFDEYPIFYAFALIPYVFTRDPRSHVLVSPTTDGDMGAAWPILATRAPLMQAIQAHLAHFDIAGGEARSDPDGVLIKPAFEGKQTLE